ncbi:hypothetical protein KLEA5_gp46 [Aeromonas phage vB_AveS_KLEA5]|nr:hypothetical protein KLEA5_gp46 [Aeromonas phage vB_AveS_KLEA5]
MVLNLILAALTFMASGYSLSLMCLLRRLRRDPRPAAAAVFVLLAFGIMQFTWAVSEPGKNTPVDYASGWVLVDFLLVALVWWLVVRSAIYFRRK